MNMFFDVKINKHKKKALFSKCVLGTLLHCPFEQLKNCCLCPKNCPLILSAIIYNNRCIYFCLISIYSIEVELKSLLPLYHILKLYRNKCIYCHHCPSRVDEFQVSHLNMKAMFYRLGSNYRQWQHHVPDSNMF